nr:uncharacterized protein LOC104647208 isoform X3 [Solanum lycopersicum]
MAFRFGGRQMAGRALLGASTQLRGYCQKISPTESSRSEKDVRACIAGGLVAFLFYSYWLRNEAWKIKESRKKRRAALMRQGYTWRMK